MRLEGERGRQGVRSLQQRVCRRQLVWRQLECSHERGRRKSRRPRRHGCAWESDSGSAGMLRLREQRMRWNLQRHQSIMQRCRMHLHVDSA